MIYVLCTHTSTNMHAYFINKKSSIPFMCLERLCALHLVHKYLHLCFICELVSVYVCVGKVGDVQTLLSNICICYLLPCPFLGQCWIQQLLILKAAPKGARMNLRRKYIYIYGTGQNLPDFKRN